ncbi:MAG: tetratricopeptide repeat protein [Deltaproteobacteria bacterium]|nr:tetratricopeptide repeat protein [Deltaproteobacteria bacterium]
MKKILLCLAILLILPAIQVSLHADASGLQQVLRQYYRGDRAGAVAALKSMAPQEPDNAALYYYLGYFEQEMGDYPAARESFRKVYKINPDFLPPVGK